MQRLVALTAAAIAILLACPDIARADNVVARWIQLGPGSSAPTNTAYGDRPTSLTPAILARAVTSDGVCPVLLLDGTLPLIMATRFTGSMLTHTPGAARTFDGGTTYPQYFVVNKSPGTFPDGTAMATTLWAECEAVVPPGHTTASIGGVALKLPVANPKRILLIGDTGCRMQGANQQNCHDPADFPFARLAGYEAQFNPDLIVHVGDYFYRDTSCTVPVSDDEPTERDYAAGCADPTSAAYETWGDTFDSWNADLLHPAAALLAAAPWVMTRGNHESCGRGARGWYALLDPHPFDLGNVTCARGTGEAHVGNDPVYADDFEPTYVVPAGAVNLLVHDSSYANDKKVDANMARNYDLDMSRLLAVLPADSLNVYVTHRPLFALMGAAPTPFGNATEQFAYSGNATAESAFKGGVPAKIALFLAGHVHQFQYANMADDARYPPQLVVGNSGDALDPTFNPDGADPSFAYNGQSHLVHDGATSTISVVVKSGLAQAEFGFAVLDATSTGFVAEIYTNDARKAGSCTITLRPRNIACWR